MRSKAWMFSLLAIGGWQLSGETMRGVLMDANCAAISNRAIAGSSAGMSSGDVSRTRSDAGDTRDMARMTPSQSGSQSGSAGGNTSTTGNTSSMAGTTGSRGNTSGSVSGSSSGNTGMTGDRSGSQSGSTMAGNTGTTGSTSGNTGMVGSTEGTRSRTDATVSGPMDSAAFTTVREKYAGCMATANTTAFAMHADGRLYLLDDASNRMVADQMRNEAFRAGMSDASGASQWFTVNVDGSASGDRLTITSVRR